MSLLKVNNPRSLLLKAENSDSLNKVVTIRNSNKIENKKVVIVKPDPPNPKPPDTKVTNSTISKNKEDGISNDKIEPFDDDLQMPSELFDCSFAQDKDEVKEIPGEYYFESDHEALRGNPDYSKLLKTYAVLQAKKIQVRFLSIHPSERIT